MIDFAQEDIPNDGLPVPEKRSPGRPSGSYRVPIWAFYFPPLYEFHIVQAPLLEVAQPRAFKKARDMRLKLPVSLKMAKPSDFLLVRTNSVKWKDEYNGILYSDFKSIIPAKCKKFVELLIGTRTDFPVENRDEVFAGFCAYQDLCLEIYGDEHPLLRLWRDDPPVMLTRPDNSSPKSVRRHV